MMGNTSGKRSKTGASRSKSTYFKERAGKLKGIWPEWIIHVENLVMMGTCSVLKTCLELLAEIFVGNVSEFKDNQYIKEVQIMEDLGIIVGRITGEYFAIGSTCPHQGAPLIEGIFEDGRIHCPRHGACFDCETGDIEEFPTIDCLPTYPVVVRRGKIYVYVDPMKLQAKMTKAMTKLTDFSSRIIIFGGGAAGYTCAQTLRQEGYPGIVTLITKEKYLPYDKSMLTKTMDCKWKNIRLRDKDFYLENEIEVKLDSYVEYISFFDHKVYIHGQLKYLTYDAIFIAVGNKPRPIKNASENGYKLKNVVSICDLESAKLVSANISGKRLLIVGSSFLAMELVTLFKDKCPSIDVLSRHKCPYDAILGGAVGKALLEHLLKSTQNSVTGKSNIKFHASNDVQCFKSNGAGAVASCITLRKSVIPCDYVIIANGVVPATDIFRNSKLKLDKITSAITVNKFMETNIKHTYAGGDCCRFPIQCAAQSTATIEHWQVAQTHGRVTAINMLGMKVSIADIIPFFWTQCGDLTIKYCGHGQSYDEVLIFGSLNVDNLEFCAVYRRGKKLIAACGVNCDKLMIAMSIALQNYSDWNTEYPPCLTAKYPEKPVQVDTCFGIHEDIETDLIKSDLEIAFMQALSYDKVQLVKEPFIPLKTNVLDDDNADVDSELNTAERDESVIKLQKAGLDGQDNMVITLGPQEYNLHFPLTEFGEDDRIPIIPGTTYVDTKQYLASGNLERFNVEVKATPSKKEDKTKVKASNKSTPKITSPRSPSSPTKIRSTPKLLKTVPTTSTTKSSKPSQYIDGESSNKQSTIEVPRQQLKAVRRKPGLDRDMARKFSMQVISGSRPDTSIKGILKPDRQSADTQKSFRAELAGVTGKPYHPNQRIRGKTSVKIVEEEVEPEITKKAIIHTIPEKGTSDVTTGTHETPRQILVAQKLSPSAEKVIATEEALGPFPDDKEYIHDKPNYKSMVTAKTTPMAKLTMKQNPEVSRARAHLSSRPGAVLEAFPNTGPPSSSVPKNDEKEKYLKRINYDFEKK